MQLKPNTQLQGGKYRIIRVLGQGGFGITYLAEQTILDKKVAIKEFFPKDFCGRDHGNLVLGIENNAETVEKLKSRFLKEAKNIANLSHPNIIKIYDIFEDNRTAYYVMDYIEGDNLNELVRQKGALTEDKAIEYILKVSNALAYIHAQNMMHFDIKPANIVVRDIDDSPILIDFGLSKQFDIHGDATSALMQRVSEGYSPIELYNVGSITNFSPQTDIYSLGATLYFLLIGQRPPAASYILNNGLSLDVQISEYLENAIQMAMHPIASQRVKDINDFINILQNSNASSESTTLIGNNECKSIMVNGHEARDLGLSVLWATKDIGAFEECDPGELYVWGDNDGSTTLKVKTSLWSRWFKAPPRSNNIAGNPEYDTASKLWGAGWRMPTINEIKELFENCEWMGIGDQLKLFGPSGIGIIIDSNKHWSAESPKGQLMAYYWIIAQNELGINLSPQLKDWSDCFFSIRPVIDRKYITNSK